MARLRSRLAAFAVALAGALAFLCGPAAASAAARGDNTAIAVNTKDGSSLFKLAFSIRTAADGVVDQTNAAVAYASCTACQTVAVAIQVVLVTNEASVQTPTNIAIAINENCDMCATLATAYQFVVPTGGPVHFTKDGKKAIHDIVKQLRDLGRSGLDIFEIQARVDSLAKQLQQVIATELVRGPPADSGDDQQQSDESGGTATTMAAPTTSTTTSSTPGVTTTTSGPTSTASSTSTSSP